MLGQVSLLLFITAPVVRSEASGESANCTRIDRPNDMNSIKKLFDPDNYDKEEHPGENGEPVVVRVSMFIASINDIKESSMEYDMQLYFRQYWRDPRLAFDRLNLTGKEYFRFSPDFILDKMWLPDSYFDNEKEGKLHSIMKKNQFLHLYRDGSIFFTTRLTLTLSCPMEFYDFPMDRQDCKLIILSYGNPTNAVVYKWLTNKTETTVFKNEIVIPQFDIEKMEITRSVRQFTIGEFSVLTLHIHFRRRLEFYLTHNYIPAILVVVISWLSFFVDRECAPARVGMGITTILTMSTLLIGVDQQNLPVVSYVKALDWYYIGCFIFVFAALCEFSIVNYFCTEHRRTLNKQQIKAAASKLEKRKEEKLSKDCLDNYGFDFSTTNPVCQMSHCGNDMPEMKDKSHENGFNMLQISDKIENLMRILYPVFFLVFNLFYWLTYRPKA